MSTNQFWLVWNPAGHAPTVKHYSSNSAKQEAERLASCNDGQDFYVLEAVSMCRVKRVEWTRLRNDNEIEIPF